MPHKFTSNDISWPQSKASVDCESFGVVYELTNPEAGAVALKVIKDNVTEKTASDIKREIENCRYIMCSLIVASMVSH